MADTFPRQYARTRRLTLGEPRNIAVSPDGRRVVFVAVGRRRRPGELPVGARRRQRRGAPRRRRRRPARRRPTPTCPPQERARRERAREQAGGIVAYATDAEATRRRVRPRRSAVRGRPADRRGARAPRRGPGVRPAARPDRPRVAYVSGRSLLHRRARRHDADRRGPRPRTSRGARPSSSPPRRWAASAATGGSPDGDRVAACRVDIATVDRWHLGRPGRSRRSPPPSSRTRPPAPTTPTSRSRSSALDGETKYLGGTARPIPYLVAVQWNRGRAAHVPRAVAGPALDPGARGRHRDARDTRASRTTATTRGSSSCPARPRGRGERLVMAADRDGVRRVLVDGAPVTPPDLQVRGIVSVERRRRASSSPTTWTSRPSST